MNKAGKNVTNILIWGVILITILRLPFLGIILASLMIKWHFRWVWKRMFIAWFIFMAVALLGFEIRHSLAVLFGW